MSVQYKDMVVERNIISNILHQNKEVEDGLMVKTESASLSNNIVADFLALKVCSLKDFIHARKFNVKSFQK